MSRLYCCLLTASSRALAAPSLRASVRYNTNPSFTTKLQFSDRQLLLVTRPEKPAGSVKGLLESGEDKGAGGAEDVLPLDAELKDGEGEEGIARRYWVNSLLLSAHSDFFRSLFSRDWQEVSKERVRGERREGEKGRGEGESTASRIGSG